MALLENVPGLLDVDSGQALSNILTELRASGYRVAYRVYNSQQLLPQKRKRVYIVAIRIDLPEACDAFRFPWLPDLNRSVGEILEEAPPPEEAPSLLLSDRRWAKIQASQAFREAPEDVLGPLDQAAAPLVSTYGGGCGSFAKYTQLVPGQGLPGGGSAPPRRFSCQECARLQGFPEGFRRASCGGPRSWYRLVGNAVSPPVVCAIAGAMICALQHGGTCRSPGTAPAIRLALEAAPAPVKAQLLARPVCGPEGEWPGPSVAELLEVLEGDVSAG